MLPTNDPIAEGGDPPKPAPPVSYHAQYLAAVVVAVAIAVVGAIQLADPAKLGLSPSAQEWAKIIGIGLGALAVFLPRVTARPSNDRTGRD